jgi:hypothetical protein
MNEDQQIAAAREREEARAKALGVYTPVEQVLDKANEREILWGDIFLFMSLLATSDSDEYITFRQKARELVDRIRSL